VSVFFYRFFGCKFIESSRLHHGLSVFVAVYSLNPANIFKSDNGLVDRRKLIRGLHMEQFLSRTCRPLFWGCLLGDKGLAPAVGFAEAVTKS